MQICNRYMDPGNWSTDIAGGSQYGFSLLFIITLSSFIAMFLQVLAAKQGLVTRRDLAQVISRKSSIIIILPNHIKFPFAHPFARLVGTAIQIL